MRWACYFRVISYCVACTELWINLQAQPVNWLPLWKASPRQAEEARCDRTPPWAPCSSPRLLSETRLHFPEDEAGSLKHQGGFSHGQQVNFKIIGNGRSRRVWAATQRTQVFGNIFLWKKSKCAARNCPSEAVFIAQRPLRTSLQCAGSFFPCWAWLKDALLTLPDPTQWLLSYGFSTP